MADNIIVSKQDANQVLRLAYDDATKSIRTSGGGSGGTTTVVQPDATQLHVTVDETALATGAATEEKQDDIISVLAGVATIDRQDTQQTSLDNIVTTSGETATNTMVMSANLTALSVKSPSGMVTEAYDSFVTTYIGSTDDISTIVYKLGVTTVATLNFSYDGQGRLSGIVKS